MNLELSQCLEVASIPGGPGMPTWEASDGSERQEQLRPLTVGGFGVFYWNPYLNDKKGGWCNEKSAQDRDDHEALCLFEHCFRVWLARKGWYVALDRATPGWSVVAPNGWHGTCPTYPAAICAAVRAVLEEKAK